MCTYVWVCLHIVCVLLFYTKVNQIQTGRRVCDAQFVENGCNLVDEGFPITIAAWDDDDDLFICKLCTPCKHKATSAGPYVEIICLKFVYKCIPRS